MKKFKWAISCFVNVVFLFNTVIFDTSAAPTMMPRTGIDYLAPISLFNNLDDSNMELQDLSRIEYILTQHLFYAKDNEGDLDIEKFVEKASAYRD
ncbi:MAG TPA: hypothetical protein PKG81_06835, partial [Candidatus Omnitrophota bacterium]|nr:hypothetical protein [Candidatus Omnitrophota bacterium]